MSFDHGKCDHAAGRNEVGVAEEVDHGDSDSLVQEIE